MKESYFQNFCKHFPLNSTVDPDLVAMQDICTTIIGATESSVLGHIDELYYWNIYLIQVGFPIFIGFTFITVNCLLLFFYIMEKNVSFSVIRKQQSNQLVLDTKRYIQAHTQRFNTEQQISTRTIGHKLTRILEIHIL